MSTTVDLPDLNVWLALACPDHSHHRQALHYWEQQASAPMPTWPPWRWPMDGGW
ncbi:hypothetical protein [Cyanobium sp. T1G-Tous]|uniref:hypothetical protein n=1 Tax=Cyanobium sp. T1G-Tous TaxID=2823722 RepID=UPI0028F41A6C|nr:hypothetical protein [Cyanobium sp. T1G-Tous]